MLQIFTSIAIAIYLLIFVVALLLKKSVFLLSILNLLSTLIIAGCWLYGYFNFGSLAFENREIILVLLELLFLSSTVWILANPLKAKLIRWMPYLIFLVHLAALIGLLLFLSFFRLDKLF
jgi:hypothetical protein